MENKEVIKSQIKTLKTILYLIMLVWLVLLCYTLYDYIVNEINPMLVLGLVLMVSAMTIISQLKKFQQKKLSDLENPDKE